MFETTSQVKSTWLSIGTNITKCVTALSSKHGMASSGVSRGGGGVAPPRNF